MIVMKKGLWLLERLQLGKQASICCLWHADIKDAQDIYLHI